ncbi:MAG: GntR family transcriptional regulator [Candidatus Hydrogenedentota bacterium]|nr:MAG: GntR family transcriptional regulator [Candidatus Hydrogenedentota bacterium]
MKPIPNTQTLANTLASRIYDDILASDLTEGDVFMTGDQVEVQYGISRGIAREALSQLRSLGILQSRQRKGLIVSRPDPVQLMSRWVPLYCRGGTEGEFEQLAQLRYVLELGAIELAVSNAIDEQRSVLSELVFEFEGVASKHGHDENADRIDLAFHSLILEMTGNPLISGMHRVISNYFAISREMDPMPGEDATTAIREHHIIADAIAQGDRELARTVLRTHLDKTIEQKSVTFESLHSVEGV